MDPTRRAADEAAKVLDALAAVSMELQCHCGEPPHKLVLSASKVRETCEKIDDAVCALKKILEIAVQNGQGPIPHLAPPTPGESAQK
jgi:hypothetical protein